MSRRWRPEEFLGALSVVAALGLAVFFSGRLLRERSQDGERRDAYDGAERRSSAGARATISDRFQSASQPGAAVSGTASGVPRRLLAKGALEVPSPLASESRVGSGEEADAGAPNMRSNALPDGAQYGGASAPPHTTSARIDAPPARPSAEQRTEPARDGAPEPNAARPTEGPSGGGKGGEAAQAASSAPKAAAETGSPSGRAVPAGKEEPESSASRRDSGERLGLDVFRGDSGKEPGEVLASARGLSVPAPQGASARNVRADAVFQGVMNQFETERKVIDHVQSYARERESSGRPADREELRAAAEEFMSGTKLDIEAVDVDALVERSFSVTDPPEPKALGDHVAETFSRFEPPTPQESEEIVRKAQEPPQRHDPPPRSALETYARNREAFDRAQRELGVQPHHILGILGVETRYGNYTGSHGVLKTLYAIAAQGGTRGKQANRDLAALMRLDQKGELGAKDAATVRGSYAGAVGVPQFLPSSWEAYALDHDGGGRDPFNHSDAILSVANYLKKHGYSKSVEKSVFGYNHSDEYVAKVLGLAERIKPGIK